MLTSNEHNTNLGELKEGEVKEWEYYIRNEGDEIIHPEIAVSCGCTTPTLSPAVLQPNSTSVLNVKFDTHGKLGYNQKVVSLRYGYKGEAKVLTIQFTAQVS